MIKNYYSLEEAELAKEILKEKGIESMIQNGPTLSGGLNQPLPEYSLFVLKKNAEKALGILKDAEKPIKNKYVPIKKRLEMKDGIIMFIIILLLIYFIPKIFAFISDRF